MKFLKTFICFIFLFSNYSFSQSLKKNFVGKNYEEMWNLYYKYQNQPTLQHKVASIYLEKAVKEKNADYIARGYAMLAFLEYDKNDEKAIQLLDKSILYSKNKKDFNFPTLPYFEKALLLKKKLLFNEAINNFILAERNSSKEDLDYHFYILLNIAVIKSEGLGEVEEAMRLYKQCYQYYKGKNYRNPKYSAIYQEILFDISDAYKSLGKHDSTSVFNKMGYHEAKITKTEPMLYLFVLSEGANQLGKGNFYVAIDSINKAIPKIKKFKNIHNLLAAYFYLGKAKEGIQNVKEAIDCYQKVDSINSIHNIMTPEFMGGYNFLINYYRKTGNKDKQLKYLVNLTSIDSSMRINYRNLTKKIKKEYDLPLLMNEKEEIITSLERENKSSKYSVWLLCLLLLGSLFYIYNQYNLKKKYKKKFEELMLNSEAKTVNLPIKNINKISSNEIAEEVVLKILTCLKEFEDQKNYLRQNLTIQLLAKDFKTNSKYLSKVINDYKKQSFIHYLNDLRINDAVQSLKEDTKLRKYTINALATEFGFNNAESFSTAFIKKTGIKPSYFIKKLEELNNLNLS